MTNRINGDFDTDSIEAFRSAYASRILSPEDQEVDERTGLPTDVVLNTSPWIQHTGLWKANDGTDKNFVPGQVLVPGEELEDIESIVDDILESEDEIEFEDEDLKEIEALLQEIEESEEEDSVLEELLNELDLDEELKDDGKEEEDKDDLDKLIESILSDAEESSSENEEENEVNLDKLIDSILSDEEETEIQSEEDFSDEEE